MSRKKSRFTDAGDRIVMDISVAEARVLMILLDRCGGDPNKSPRKYVDSLGSALQAAGIQPVSQEVNDWCTGDLSFRNGDIAKNWPKNPDYKGFEVREKKGNTSMWQQYPPISTKVIPLPPPQQEVDKWWAEIYQK